MSLWVRLGTVIQKLMPRQWDKTNCLVTHQTHSGAMVGRSPVTRKPIFQENTQNIELRAFLKMGRFSARNIMPGAEGVIEGLIGHLHREEVWPDALSQKSIVTVTFTQTGQIFKGQILRSVFAWIDDQRKGRTGAMRRTGERFMVNINYEDQS